MPLTKESKIQFLFARRSISVTFPLEPKYRIQCVPLADLLPSAHEQSGRLDFIEDNWVRRTLENIAYMQGGVETPVAEMNEKHSPSISRRAPQAKLGFAIKNPRVPEGIC